MRFGSSIVQQEEILDEIRRRLSDALRPGWSRARFRWVGVVGGSMSSLSVVDEEGNTRVEDLPDGIGLLCRRLKATMYRRGVGTWFTMTYELSADGSYRTGFDYEGEPETGGFAPEDYAKEITRFPRDPEHIPAWLRKTLDRVPNVYIGIHAEPGDRYKDGYGPCPDEIAWAFVKEGWQAGHGEYGGEFEFSTDWATLRTLTDDGVVQLAGKIYPDRWDDLIAVLTRQGWRFRAALHDGDGIIKQTDSFAEPSTAAPGNGHAVGHVA
ncbi:hypothetical protein NE235_26095 [Actinoallomurus spadix]|uniref:Uncharacterized protein n=1 Tax=Actinoallomurus spadix TaxID=79912 RepID=A0ABP3GN13_9ACTN|nr:hypothetical protein [Actinoallomurus spadix]MCO5989586.1 hypothetical protein [Actinoallomurus spadix]